MAPFNNKYFRYTNETAQETRHFDANDAIHLNTDDILTSRNGRLLDMEYSNSTIEEEGGDTVFSNMTARQPRIVWPAGIRRADNLVGIRYSGKRLESISCHLSVLKLKLTTKRFS